MSVVAESAKPWTVHLLGGFNVVGPRGRVELPHSAARVVAYLAIQAHPLPRTAIAAAIWPDVDEGRSRANLRSTVSRIGVLAPLVLATTTTLAMAQSVTVDVDDLQAYVASTRQADRVGAGPPSGFDRELLPGWTEEWVDLERERVRQLELHLLDDIVTSSVHNGRHGDGVDAALRAIRLDPLRESSHAGLLRALLAGGNRAAAISHFRRVAATMRRELGLAPSGDLTALIDEILPSRPARRS
ncbi:MAG: BTAD domain-containing putative transcriptional regulator [Lapillicoccus sp.]